MCRITILLLTILVSITTFSQQRETVYLWESPDGTVNEVGGTIAQHNSLAVSRVNYPSSGYHTIQLCGKKENIGDEDNSLNSVYFTITLSGSATFRKGDSVEITAMRNNDGGGKANIHFVYGGAGKNVIVEDTTVWANLGQMHEMSINGGTSAKASPYLTEGLTGAGTEPIGELSLEPSTNTFSVPVAAEGSATLTLTRNDSQCMLYITKLLVTRTAAEKKYARADVNEDGVVDINDVNAVIDIICGNAQ